MIYLTILKIYRWSVFIVLALGIFYAGMQNTPNINLPFKSEIAVALGVIICYHFALVMFYGAQVKEIFLRLYWDNHYTIVMPNGIKRTVDALTFREIQHEYDDVEGVKIYYNNPDGTPNAFKRIV